MERECITVSELTQRIKITLESEFEDLRVRGEVVRPTTARSGHVYFTLKDGDATLKAVAWRTAARFLLAPVEEGVELICAGHLSLYPPRGEYQLVVRQTEAVGTGNLLADLERLKETLSREGLFDPARRRPLPYLPRAVGLVTSPTGAARRDVERTLLARFPCRIILCPARVQGDEAAGELVRALRTLDRHRDVDVIIFGRGGGSFEDLLPFSDEAVVRAVAACVTPVVSAVGHEPDTPLCDLAADARAATPTAAAELVVPDKVDLDRWVKDSMVTLRRRVERPLDERTQRLADLGDGLVRAGVHALDRAGGDLARLGRSLGERHPRAAVETRAASLGLLRERLTVLGEDGLRRREEAVARLDGLLGSLGPDAQLSRGWALVRRLPGRDLITDAGDLVPGDRVEIRLGRGRAAAEVIEAEE
ncbi:MAG: exodeoxyribonuclease VII large subunit [Pseudomonadota bacterium]